MLLTTEQLWEDFHVPLRQFILAQKLHHSLPDTGAQ